jgi:hypothetical protein
MGITLCSLHPARICGDDLKTQCHIAARRLHLPLTVIVKQAPHEVLIDKTNKMGFNIQGIATSIKTKSINDLTDLLGLASPTMIDTTYFERATSSLIEGNEVFLTSTNNGTILTVGQNFPIKKISLEKLSVGAKALKFIISETVMVFAFEYYENGKLIRSVVNIEDDSILEEGEPLVIEQGETDFTEIIFGLMKTVVGESVYTLDPGFKSVRYNFSKQ